MSIVKKFPNQNKGFPKRSLSMLLKLILPLLIIIFAFFMWNNFDSDKNNSLKRGKLDKQFINPVTKKDERGEIVEAVLTESFDYTRIQSINPVSPLSTQELTPQYPPEASNTALLFMAQNLSPKYSVDKYMVKFKSTDQKNEPIIITSQIFVPNTGGVKKLPVYVFGQGTTGIGDNCAPSKEQPNKANWANYTAHMLAFSAQGYIVVFPDYEGFNDPSRIHHYFNSELESRVLLDASRAVYKFADQQTLSVKPDQALFLAGFSQGGQAVLSAKDFAKNYAPNLPIKGIIAYAPATDVGALLKEAPALGPYLIYSYSDFYGKETIDPVNALAPRWLQTLERDVNSICVDQVYKYYGYDPRQIYSQQFYDALFNNNLETNYPKFKQAIDMNTTGFENSEIPLVIYQGMSDPIVTATTVRGVRRKLCNSGNKVFYKEYSDIDHFKIRQISYRDSLSFMKNILNGQTPPSNCNFMY